MTTTDRGAPAPQDDFDAPQDAWRGGGELERLIAETLGVGRPRPASAAALAPPPSAATPPATSPPHPRPARPKPAAPPSWPQPETARAAIEPLKLKRRRPVRLAAGLTLTALAGGLGWWAATGGLNRFLREQGPPRPPPIIAAAPPAGRPATPEEAGGQIQPATPPAVASAPVQPPLTSPPSPPAPQPVPTAPPPAAPAPARADPAPPADSAGILGVVQTTPFDQAGSPRPVRTLSILPTGATVEAPPQKPIDFDDPSTWPPGAERAEPHPLPPARR